MHPEEPLTEDPGDEGDDSVVAPDNVEPVKERYLEDAPEEDEA